MCAARPIQLIVIVWLSAVLTSCSNVDLREAIEITDVSTGWHDNGLRSGWTHFVPNITFRVKNSSTVPISNVGLTVSFWKEGGDGEFDEVLLRGIRDEPLAAGATTEPIVARGTVGYNLEGPRTELFARSPFKDVIAKIFARRGGRIVPKGEYKIERKILTPASPPPGHP